MQDIDNPTLYHAIYNTAGISIYDIAGILIEHIRSTWEQPLQAGLKPTNAAVCKLNQCLKQPHLLDGELLQNNPN